MRITTQFKIILIVFSVILLSVGLSIAYTVQQVGITQRQENLANGIVVSANELSYLSSDYVIYHGTTQLAQWQVTYASFSNQVGNLSVTTAQQKDLVRTMQLTRQQVAAVFSGIVSSTSSSQSQTSSNQSLELETAWARMSVQTTSLTSDATQLAHLLQDQVNQENLVNYALIIGMIVAFILLLATIYVQTFRHTLKSLSDLKAGASVIGSGNLNFKLDETKKDEIGELSQAFNQMTTNLKNVTSSKTDLEHTQAALKEASEQTEFERKRLETILETNPSAVVIVEASNGKFSYANKRALELYGFDTLGLTLDENVAKVKAKRPDGSDYPIEEMPVSHSLKHGQEVHDKEIILSRPDGQTFPVTVSSAPLRDMQGNISAAIVVFEDITERKKAEDATAKQAELIDLSPDAIIVRKLDGMITFWSQGAEKLYGITKSEAIGQNINTLLKTEFPQPQNEILKNLKQDGKWSGEIVHISKDGNKVIEQSYWLARFDAKGKIFEMLESNVDITDRVELQIKLQESAVRVEEYANQMEELAEKRAAQLKDAERLAAIGATAGMVGHDIRNPLQAITSDVYLAKSDLSAMPEGEEKDNLTESLDGISKNVEYINKIVQDLQDYARPIKPVARETSLPAVIDDIIHGTIVPDRVKVHVKVQNESAFVIADPDIVKRVLTNLVTNAVQAMPEGGELDIKAYQDSNDTVITVKDTGVGIPEEVKPRLFTPLFTTKSKGQGFG
ncbi:MAG TPA: PAS domain S-box protein, partial [Candidatus Nanoarchaeia archaeon]|nr:PAS domain S-box protein [Candidatus Nanoarchaeia archaeon]